ncbi:MAG: glycine--tRNA ligase subunit beta [Actinomycetota bacterium]|nr:MAG: glycyl-tRNA synthetase beta [Actinomycetota bacterium]MDO8950461.1 glycine--tRNA ligase subunit beta [Actinomycetota bacterium]MDP3631417.1 glycine--tRNA ligase subunit beta [Actinomycetota bacterium]
MSSRDLVFEIGVEEIPSAPLYAAVTQLKNRAEKALNDAHLSYGSIAVYGAPRRLALVVRDLADRQADVTLRHKGPAVKAAFDADGAPTKAAEGFARGKGVAVADLTTEETDGGSYIFAIVEQKGSATIDVLPTMLRDLAGAIEWPKSMRWGSGTDRFIRPVRWLVALFDETVVDVEYAGVKAGRTSSGHRFLGVPVEIPSADAYLESLTSVMVLADSDVRSAAIRNAVEAAGAKYGARAVIPEKTFAEVVNLVEWPTVGVGTFDEAFLAVPREVLEEAMESHQRYFPVEKADGSLAPHFIVVHNGDPARTDAIIAGHERVIRARLADAAFFYHEDLKQPLEAYVDQLSRIVFQEKLGSLGDKVLRIEALTRALAAQADAAPDDEAYAVRAAHLAKADLVTHAVVEFTSLQGLMGRYYALASGESEGVADAIVDHYRPKFAGDVAPRSLAGMLVSAADKFDTIAGIFAIGQAPTGSADPFALRRFGIGILTMMLDAGLKITLDDSIAAALGGYRDTLPNMDVEAVGADIKAFLLGRLEGIMRDRGHAYDTVTAVLAVAGDDPADALARAEALTAVRAEADAIEDLSVAFARASKLAKPELGVDADAALMGPEDSALAVALAHAEGASAEALARRDYAATLRILAELRPSIDAFFAGVLVMDPDESIRTMRLQLLNRFVRIFSEFADLGALAG